MSETNGYPGVIGSDMAVVCDERIYSFYTVPDLRTLAAHKTYLMQVTELDQNPDQVGYTFYETPLDLSDASWYEIVATTKANGDNVWAVKVRENVLSATGGCMVVGSRLNQGKYLQFDYDNLAGYLVVSQVEGE